MKTESMVDEMGTILSPEEVSTVKGGQSKDVEYTYEGGELDEIIVTPPHK